MTDLIVDPGYSPYGSGGYDAYDPYASESTVPDNIWSPGYDYSWDPLHLETPESTSTVPDNIWSPGLDYNEGGNGEWTSSDPIYSPGYDYTTTDSTDSSE